MRQKLRANGELLTLVALFLVFLGAVYRYKETGNESLPRSAPSSLNPAPPGNKALFLLLSRLGYRADRLEAGWRFLSKDAGLLIVVEPLVSLRRPSNMEVSALRRWIEQGGTLLYVLTAPARPLDPNDPVAGDIEVVAGSAIPEILPVTHASPFLRSVTRISVISPVRLRVTPDAGYECLLKDAGGVVLLHKAIGQGHLFVAADQDLTSNSGIAKADNAILMVNVASIATGANGRTVLFDEYHHGAGFESDDGAAANGLWNSTPAPIRLALVHALVFITILAYNANRRFGPICPAVSPEPHESRGTDYIDAMARLYRRSRSSDVALENMAAEFRRDLSRRLSILPEAPITDIIASVEQRYQVDTQLLGTLLESLERVSAGERITEADMMAQVREIDAWKRRLELAGP